MTEIDRRKRRDQVIRAGYGVAVLTAAYLLKSFYRQADAGELAWIIAPTAWLTEALSELSFTPEAGYGWQDLHHRVVIAPACAGVNFLIIAFCMASFLVLRSTPASGKSLTGGITAAALSAYLLTITANTARIIVSTILYDTVVYPPWMTPGMLHRLSGTAIFYGALCLYYQIWFVVLAESLCEDGGRAVQPGGQSLRSSPLLWYLAVSIGIPISNHAFTNDPELFVRHAVSVITVTMTINLIVSRGLRVFNHKRNI